MRRGRKPIEPIERFHSKYIVNEETGCWEWKKPNLYHGYGEIRIEGKTIKSHQFSYQYFNGPLEKGLVICHNCFNKKCVRPDHLRQDTLSSNSLDTISENKHSRQILTIEDVIEIKKSLLFPYRGIQRDLAKKYNVNRTTINEINKGRNWSHIKI
jgi:hypothetical protein